MAVIGTPRSLHERARFIVEIPGFAYSGFEKCSELKATVALRKHYEGGSVMAHKGPGRFDMENITLERGATTDLQIYTWFSQVAQLSSGTGQIAPHFKRDISIVQQSRSGTAIMRWHVYGCFPIEFVAGEWDNSSDEVVITKLVLAADYFDPQIETATMEVSYAAGIA
jgi:phage tail-like protein